jgi:hypothetical protein
VEAALPDQLVSDTDHVALSRLAGEISWRIDHGQAGTVWELFIPHGVLATSGTPLAGHGSAHMRHMGTLGTLALVRSSVVIPDWGI